eukprot:Awhi_evm1s15653
MLTAEAPPSNSRARSNSAHEDRNDGITCISKLNNLALELDGGASAVNIFLDSKKSCSMFHVSAIKQMSNFFDHSNVCSVIAEAPPSNSRARSNSGHEDRNDGIICISKLNNIKVVKKTPFSLSIK